MYQVLHDTNNVTDSCCHCVSADHSSSLQGCWQCQWQVKSQVPVAVLLQVQNCLLNIVWPSIWDKSSDFEIGQLGRPWVVWYVPCKRICVPRFTKLKVKHRHRHRNDRRWRCETHSVGTRWQSVGDPHDAILTVSDELSLESPIQWQWNVLLQSLASIPQIYQSIF